MSKDQATIAHEVETSYEAYANAFNHREMETVLRYVSAPYVLTIGGNVPWVSETPQQVRRHPPLLAEHRSSAIDGAVSRRSSRPGATFSYRAMPPRR